MRVCSVFTHAQSNHIPSIISATASDTRTHRVLDNNNEKLSHTKSMHRKFSRKKSIGLPTIGFMCKELQKLQSICSDYGGGMAHSKHAFFLRS